MAPEDQPCTYDEFEEHCDGDTIVKCSGGIVSRTDCADLEGPDYACIERDTNPHTKCVDPETYCDRDTFNHRCEGDVMVYCSFEEVQTTDCAERQSGDTCVEGQGIPESSYDWCEPS